MTTTRRGFTAIAAGAILISGCILASGVSRADVALKQKTVIEGVGEGARPASERTSTLVVSGDKMRKEPTGQAAGNGGGRFGGEAGAKTVLITRIDRRLTYQVNTGAKNFFEIPFGEGKDLRGRPEGASGRRAPSYKCEPIRLEAKRTGKKETVNGFPGEGATVAGTQVCQDVEKKQTCTIFYTLDSWLTPVTPPIRELETFEGKLALAMGLDTAQVRIREQLGPRTRPQFTEGFGSVYKELSKIQGYPVRSRLVVENEGACDFMAGGGPGARGSRGERGRRRGMRTEGQEAAGDKPPAPEKSAPAGSSRSPVFGMTTDILEVTASPAAADAFEPPAGFIKRTPAKRAVPAPKKPG
jgi:hypothetical protein